MTERIPIKEEDEFDLMQFISPKLRNQILQDHEIVNRLRERIKGCKDGSSYHRQLKLELKEIMENKK